MKTTVPNSLVSVDWLYQNLDAKNLLILDATIAKITAKKNNDSSKKNVIKKARFFDIKNVFSKQNTTYPNTVLTAGEFQKKAQKLGIQKDSCIVVYDDLGIYSSPRVWWLFKLMGFDNIAVLNGGFPAWKKGNFPQEETKKSIFKEGNFIANFNPEKVKNTNQVLIAINTKNNVVVDARSKERFNGTEPEPRKEVRSGHIPNSVNLPYRLLQSDGKMKSNEELQIIFKKINPKSKKIIFSCGSGITACILALGANLIKNKKYAVYDGSWTEWGSRIELPIKNK